MLSALGAGESSREEGSSSCGVEAEAEGEGEKRDELEAGEAEALIEAEEIGKRGGSVAGDREVLTEDCWRGEHGAGEGDGCCAEGEEGVGVPPAVLAPSVTVI